MNVDGAISRLGQTIQVKRGDETHAERGVVGHDGKKGLFYPSADVQVGDWLETESGDNLRVVDTQRGPMIDGKPLALDVRYETKADYDRRTSERWQAQSHAYNFYGNVYGSVFGSQENVRLEQSFTFEELDRQIEEHGGEDIEALREMVAEIRSTLENQDSITRNRFLQWSELLNKHSWITGAIAQMLVLYTFTGQLG